MSNFTGSEWICSENGNGDFFIDSSRGESIGILYKDVPEVEANARLISAAPEMYETLKNINKAFAWFANLNEKTLIKPHHIQIFKENAKINELLAWIDGNKEKKNVC